MGSMATKSLINGSTTIFTGHCHCRHRSAARRPARPMTHRVSTSISENVALRLAGMSDFVSIGIENTSLTSPPPPKVTPASSADNCGMASSSSSDVDNKESEEWGWYGVDEDDEEEEYSYSFSDSQVGRLSTQSPTPNSEEPVDKGILPTVGCIWSLELPKEHLKIRNTIQNPGGGSGHRAFKKSSGLRKGHSQSCACWESVFASETYIDCSVKISDFRIVSGESRRHAQYLVVFSLGAYDLQRWVRYSQFSKFMRKYLRRMDRQCFVRLFREWEDLQRTETMFRNLEEEYLNDRCQKFERLVRQLVFESTALTTIHGFLSYTQNHK